MRRHLTPAVVLKALTLTASSTFDLHLKYVTLSALNKKCSYELPWKSKPTDFKKLFRFDVLNNIQQSTKKSRPQRKLHRIKM